MTTTKHTPGPWSVDGEGIKAIVRDANMMIVAIRHRMPGDAHEANARLIAAAPDLLAALNGFVINEQNLNDEHFAGVQERLMKLARAAIAKATGGVS
jgi:hypothetical protein